MPIRPNSPSLPLILDENGATLTAGFIYIGSPDLDSSTNQVDCYYDIAMTQKITQPIKITNGLPKRGSATTTVYIDADDYSIEVQNSSGTELVDITSVVDSDELVAFTPTWTCASTPPAIGDGTLTGKYCLAGRIATVFIDFTAGASTTYGTGAWSFALPFAAARQKFMGTAYILDTGTAYSLGVCQISSGASTVEPKVASAAGTVTASAPQTWAVGDTLTMSITYCIAA